MSDRPIPPPPTLGPEELEALFYGAVRDGRLDLLAAFLDGGADPNRPDARGFPPIVLASYNGQKDATALLLARARANVSR